MDLDFGFSRKHLRLHVDYSCIVSTVIITIVFGLSRKTKLFFLLADVKHKQTFTNTHTYIEEG